jgi:hypothetical protein
MDELRSNLGFGASHFGVGVSDFAGGSLLRGKVCSVVLPKSAVDPEAVLALPDDFSEFQLRRLKGSLQLLGQQFGSPSGERSVVNASELLKAAADGVQRSQEVVRSGGIFPDDEVDVGPVLLRERAGSRDIFEPHV